MATKENNNCLVKIWRNWNICTLLVSMLNSAATTEKRMTALKKKENTIVMQAWMLSRFSCVWVFATLWTIACQAPLSMGFSRQEYWSGLSLTSLGGLSNPGIEPTFDLIQSHGLDSAYLKGNGLLKQSMMSSGEYLIWKGWYSTMLKRNVLCFFVFFFPHNILTLGFATKTSNMRYESNLSKDCC